MRFLFSLLLLSSCFLAFLFSCFLVFFISFFLSFFLDFCPSFFPSFSSFFLSFLLSFLLSLLSFFLPSLSFLLSVVFLSSFFLFFLSFFVSRNASPSIWGGSQSALAHSQGKVPSAKSKKVSPCRQGVPLASTRCAQKTMRLSEANSKLAGGVKTGGISNRDRPTVRVHLWLQHAVRKRQCFSRKPTPN